MAQIILDSANNVIQGDFDTATLSLRTRMQTSTTNATTGVYAVPNGTATSASFQASNAADPTNASKIVMATNGSTDVQIVSGANGSGTYLPLSFYVNNDIRFQMGTAGQLSVRTAPGTVSAGTSGQFLTSVGPSGGVSWTTASGYAGPNYQAFTSPGTFTIPASTTSVKVTVIGGGGGGSNGVSNSSSGGGGGSGGLSIGYITGLTPGGSVTVTVGSGGGAGSGSGGTSSFGPAGSPATTISATGGAGGGSGTGGAGGTGTGYGVLVGGTGGGGGGKYTYGGTGGVFFNTGTAQSTTSIYSLYGQRGGGGSVASPGPVATAGLVGGGGGGSGGNASFPSGPGAGAGGGGLVLVEY